MVPCLVRHLKAMITATITHCKRDQTGRATGALLYAQAP